MAAMEIRHSGYCRIGVYCASVFENTRKNINQQTVKGVKDRSKWFSSKQRDVFKFFIYICSFQTFSLETYG